MKSMSTSCGTKEMPPNNLRKSVAKFTDFIRFTLNKMRRLFSGSSLGGFGIHRQDTMIHLIYFITKQFDVIFIMAGQKYQFAPLFLL